MASETIAAARDRVVANILDAYDAVSRKGGTLPTARNSNNLAAAIQSIVISSGVTVFGAIVVDFPAGSICTCSDGSTTYTAGSTGGNWVFTVPVAGTWTVTAIDGTESVSESVSITTQGQGGYVELKFDLYIIKNGIIQTPPGFSLKTVNTAAAVQQGEGYYQISSGANAAGLATDTKINLSEYSRILMDCDVTKVVTSGIFAGVMLGYIEEVTTGNFNTFKPPAYATQASLATQITMSLDLSSVDLTLYRVFVCGGCSYGNGSIVQIRNLWLEK